MTNNYWKEHRKAYNQGEFKDLPQICDHAKLPWKDLRLPKEMVKDAKIRICSDCGKAELRFFPYQPVKSVDLNFKVVPRD